MISYASFGPETNTTPGGFEDYQSDHASSMEFCTASYDRDGATEVIPLGGGGDY